MMVWRSLYRVARDAGSNISRRALFFSHEPTTFDQDESP